MKQGWEIDLEIRIGYGIAVGKRMGTITRGDMVVVISGATEGEKNFVWLKENHPKFFQLFYFNLFLFSNSFYQAFLHYARMANRWHLTFNSFHHY